MLSAHSLTGIGHVKDLTWAMVKGCIQLGSAPAIDLLLDLTPVDYASRAIVHVSRQPTSLNKTFHLFNTQSLSWNTLVGWMKTRGYALRHLPYGEWYAELRHAVEQSTGNALSPFMPIFPVPGEEGQMAQAPQAVLFDAKNTSDGLANTAITCPPVDSTLLTIYFTHFVRSGFLCAPPEDSFSNAESEAMYQNVS
jgi:thioester reductase-like protein